MASFPTRLGPVFVDDQGSADEPVALLWPSLFSDHAMWRHQVPALRATGWRTLAIDPPGHGDSVGPGRSFTMDECADAAIDLLDGAGVRAPVAVPGTSWGRFVAPALVVSGAQDTILPTPLGKAIAAKLPNASHVEIADAAHLIPLETPDAADELILECLERWKGRCR